MYQLNSEHYSSVFVTPAVIVDKYIKMASFCAIKSLLWILKNQGGNFSVEEIAKAVGSSVADTKEALEYWENEGVLINNESVKVPEPLKSDTQLKTETIPSVVSFVTPAKVPEIKIVRPTTEQIVKRMNEDNRIKGLFNIVQELLGRTIGFDMQSALLMMYDTYGLDFDIILTLVQFCIDEGKTSNAFILSVAKQWYEKDITTLEQAHAYIDSHGKAEEMFNEFKLFTGVTSPKPTPKQAEMFCEWNKMGYSVEMIVLAYNEAVERNGKISFPYMNGIIKRWNNDGIKSPADIENAKQDFKNKSLETNERSYDIEKAVEKAEYEPVRYKKKKKES